VSVSALEILIRNRLSPTNTYVFYHKVTALASFSPTFNPYLEPYYLPWYTFVMTKDSFFNLLNKAIRPPKPEPKSPQKSEPQTGGDYNGTQTR
jgi:hypothetical protein